MGASSGRETWWIEWEVDGRPARMVLDRPVQIGRSDTSDIQLLEPTVSRRHAVVSITDDQACVDASLSRNGLRFGSAYAARLVLRSGQSFAIGHTAFRVRKAPDRSTDDWARLGPTIIVGDAASALGEVVSQRDTAVSIHLTVIVPRRAPAGEAEKPQGGSSHD